MKDTILEMLRESEDYVSGQELCDKFNVSRTAVWKAINQLKEEGYLIEAVRNRGYKLTSAPDCLYEKELKSRLHTEWFGNHIKYFDSVDSTNNVIKRCAEENPEHGLLAVAEEQTAGRGRRGHSWTSPSGTGVWMSLELIPDISPEKASMLTLVAAMAISSAIDEICGLSSKIKWPNDIVINGRKVCGMLTELSAELTRINYVVVGIGINVNTTEFPEEIKETATSLFIESGSKEKINRAELIACSGKWFEIYYDKFIETGDLSLLVDEYNERLVNAGRQVRVIERDNEKIYTAVGIDSEGLLVVKNEDGSIETVRSGEVSVRGLYGYT